MWPVGYLSPKLREENWAGSLSLCHLHLVAMKAIDVGLNFLVGEFRVTGREKGWMLSPRHLWIIAGWREANLQTLGSPSLGGKESAGSILCYKS